MGRYVAWRLALVVPLLLVISLLTFALGRLSPGDPIRSALNETLGPEAIAALRASYGLDRPWPQQYLDWVGGLFTDGGGRSIVQGTPVLTLLGPAFANTALLALAAVVVAVVAGTAVGTVAGLNHRRGVDRAIMLLVAVGSNLSVYWFGLVLVWVFALRLRVLPATGMRDLRAGGGPLDVAGHLVLPALGAALISLLVLARFVRAGVVESLQSDYVRTFRAHGLPRWTIVRRHVARNVAPIVVTTTGLEIGTLLSGVVFVESVFNWPGLGSQMVTAISGHDYPVIQGGVLLIAVVFVVVNLLTDLAGRALDPRRGRETT